MKRRKPIENKTLEQLQARLAHFQQISSDATQEGRAIVRQKIQQLNEQINQLEVCQR